MNPNMRARGLLTAALLLCLAHGIALAIPAAVVATAKDDGRTLTLTMGPELRVRLQANRSTGYGWKIAVGAAPVLTEEGEPTYKSGATTAGAVGGGGVETWRFRAAQSGRRTLRMEYRRPWEREVPPAAAVTLRIVVE